MPSEVSKFDKRCVQECLIKIIIVVMLVITIMLFWLIWAIRQCSAEDSGGAGGARAPLEFCHPGRNISS